MRLEGRKEGGRGLHLVLLVLAVVPAVASLGYQQRDDVTFREAEQRAVVAGRVREDGLDARAAVLLQPRRHGTGPGQGPRLAWEQEGGEGEDDDTSHWSFWVQVEVEEEAAACRTYGGLALGRLVFADGQRVGVDLADLPLRLGLRRRLWGARSPLRRAALGPVLLPLHACGPVDQGHAVRSHHPLPVLDTKG